MTPSLSYYSHFLPEMALPETSTPVRHASPITNAIWLTNSLCTTFREERLRALSQHCSAIPFNTSLPLSIGLHGSSAFRQSFATFLQNVWSTGINIIPGTLRKILKFFAYVLKGASGCRNGSISKNLFRQRATNLQAFSYGAQNGRKADNFHLQAEA